MPVNSTGQICRMHEITFIYPSTAIQSHCYDSRINGFEERVKVYTQNSSSLPKRHQYPTANDLSPLELLLPCPPPSCSSCLTYMSNLDTSVWSVWSTVTVLASSIARNIGWLWWFWCAGTTWLWWSLNWESSWCGW